MLPAPRPPRAPLRVLPLLLCFLLLAGCSGRPPGSAAERDVRGAVADWSRTPPGRLAAIPLEDWAYEVASVRRDGVRARVRARLSYRLAGYDASPAGSERELELAGDGGTWRVLSDRPAPGAPAQPWDLGEVTVVRGAHVLVLGSAARETLDEVAAGADRAVPAASAAWPGPWAGRVVVLVPGTLDGMARLLGRPAEEYRGMGAVTTGRVGAGTGPADRVVINPEGYAELSGTGRRVVLTHEVTHVATRAATTATTPLWLSEGFADWAAYRGTPTTPGQAAPALARAVRRGELPAELPPAQAFAFGGDPQTLARAYEGAWLACRLIAAKWGEAALADLYERAGREPFPAALDEALGTDPAALTKAWQESLRGELGP
ncbi:hypothetical protein ACFWUZ_27455 [Streptomyces sp. NPDC058646]|uniref:hypothetical protein n=1 Tax=Streptomyces sp. NPDC058646 TaxID=3346574 RepID=UPI0036499690